ncbi:MAG: DUF885 domain-containing protein [Gemmatimonadota bacterium]
MLAALVGGCSEGAAPRLTAEQTVSRVSMLADRYTGAYYTAFPEEASEMGFSGAPIDRVSNRSPAARAEWAEQTAAWLTELEALDAALLDDAPEALEYAYLKERLMSEGDWRRLCQMSLWNVSPTWTGWQSGLALAFSDQPVGTDDWRAATGARARDVARYLDTEIANLREGLEKGYSAPVTNVDAVIAQVEAMASAEPHESPFFDPALRDSTPEFQAYLSDIVQGEITPAIMRYRGFLRDEYRAQARTDIGVSANPAGAECYRAALRYYTSLDLTPEEVHDTGLEQMESIRSQLTEIGARSFGVSDPGALLRLVQDDPLFTFESRQAIVAYAQSAVDRARAALPGWFGVVPEVDVVIRPYPEYQEQSAPGGFYSAGSGDGPGTYWINTYDPASQSKAGLEATAFHETWPGHHMQSAVNQALGSVPAILKYFYNAGFDEGWALYTERLADEMGLYSSDVDRIGLLSNEALRAARLVVDPGMHALGWTRQQAIDYLLENTASSPQSAASEIDRYIAVPGQATSYMTGSLEIRRLRDEAERSLGDAFEVSAFHDQVLSDGSLALTMLRAKIEAWLAAEKSARAQ